jgi:hypothetical protein
MSYAPAYPHDPIEEIGQDVFMVRGTIRLNALMRITRNMTIIRHQGALTLVDPIRLTPEGEGQLKRLGEVRRILRLGALHGVDDPYYVDNFGAELWSQAGGSKYTQPPIDVTLTEDTELPFPDAKVFCFNETVEPESYLLIECGGGLLLSCDAIQHYGDYRHNNLLARTVMPFIGFPSTTIIGPLWLKMMTPKGGSLKGDFERLLTLKFDSLLSAHGSFRATGAHAAVQAAFDKAFPG